jgi:hypothetical protein
MQDFISVSGFSPHVDHYQNQSAKNYHRLRNFGRRKSCFYGRWERDREEEEVWTLDPYPPCTPPKVSRFDTGQTLGLCAFLFTLRVFRLCYAPVRVTRTLPTTAIVFVGRSACPACTRCMNNTVHVIIRIIIRVLWTIPVNKHIL